MRKVPRAVWKQMSTTPRLWNMFVMKCCLTIVSSQRDALQLVFTKLTLFHLSAFTLMQSEMSPYLSMSRMKLNVVACVQPRAAARAAPGGPVGLRPAVGRPGGAAASTRAP